MPIFFANKSETKSTNQKHNAKSRPPYNMAFEYSSTVPLHVRNRLIDLDHHKPVWPKENKPLRQQKIQLVMCSPPVTGSLTSYPVHEGSSPDSQPPSPKEPLKSNKSSREIRASLIRKFPDIPKANPVYYTSLITRNEKYYNSSDWPRDSTLGLDPFRRSKIHLPHSTGSLLDPHNQYQQNRFPVLGSRDAVAHTDRLPENRTLGAEERTTKLRVEREAMRRPHDHGRSDSSTAQPTSSSVRASKPIERHGRFLTVDGDKSRDSTIYSPHQRPAPKSLPPSQHLRAYMSVGADAVRKGPERHIIYQQSHAAAPQHAHTHYYSQDLAQSVAKPSVRLDTHGHSEQSTSPRYTHSRRDLPKPKYSYDSEATLLDADVSTDAKDSVNSTIQPTLPLKLLRHKLPKSSSGNISPPQPLTPFKNPRKNSNNQVPVYPHVTLDGNVKLMAGNNFLPTRERQRKRHIKNEAPVLEHHSYLLPKSSYFKDNAVQSSSMGRQTRH